MKKHKWLIRPSQMGQLMTSGRGKDKIFGDTALTVIEEAVKFHKWGLEPEQIEDKKMDKGTFNEPQNIDLASKVLGWKGVSSKAEKIRLINDYFIGEPDINTPDLLADIKSSWSAKTFPFFRDPMNKNYKAQLHCYMDLTGKDEAELVYCLSNHPDHIFNAEVKRMTYYYAERPHLFPEADGIDELWTLAEEKAENKIKTEGVFDQMDDKDKVKRFIIKKDPEYMAQIHERVLQARELFDKLIKL